MNVPKIGGQHWEFMLFTKLLLLYLFPVSILILSTALLVICMWYVDDGFNNELFVLYSDRKESLLVFVALR